MNRLPALTARRVIQALERGGFHVARIKGSHYLLKHVDNPRLRGTVPYHRGELDTRTLRSIIEQAGLEIEEFVKLL
jgi:predicted RNA binding protein YcfA (HicA-like mRNA interferase family)